MNKKTNVNNGIILWLIIISYVLSYVLSCDEHNC